MEFFSTEFQRETPELSTPGLSTPSEPLVTASPMSAFDLYRHNRVWESNSYLRSRQKWGLIEQIFIIDCKCHILIHVIMYVLIIKFKWYAPELFNIFSSLDIILQMFIFLFAGCYIKILSILTAYENRFVIENLTENNFLKRTVCLCFLKLCCIFNLLKEVKIWIFAIDAIEEHCVCYHHTCYHFSLK